MPFNSPSAAAFSAALTCSLVAGLPRIATRSTTETSGVGTRMEYPSSLPFNCGITNPMALAAPVVVREVEHVLVVGVTVDRGHRSLFDAERVVQHLHHRRQAVGGARCVG